MSKQSTPVLDRRVGPSTIGGWIMVIGIVIGTQLLILGIGRRWDMETFGSLPGWMLPAGIALVAVAAVTAVHLFVQDRKGRHQ